MKLMVDRNRERQGGKMLISENVNKFHIDSIILYNIIIVRHKNLKEVCGVNNIK